MLKYFQKIAEAWTGHEYDQLAVDTQAPLARAREAFVFEINDTTDSNIEETHQILLQELENTYEDERAQEEISGMMRLLGFNAANDPLNNIVQLAAGEVRQEDLIPKLETQTPETVNRNDYKFWIFKNGDIAMWNAENGWPHHGQAIIMLDQGGEPFDEDTWYEFDSNYGLETRGILGRDGDIFGVGYEAYAGRGIFNAMSEQKPTDIQKEKLMDIVATIQPLQISVELGDEFLTFDTIKEFGEYLINGPQQKRYLDVGDTVEWNLYGYSEEGEIVEVKWTKDPVNGMDVPNVYVVRPNGQEETMMLYPEQATKIGMSKTAWVLDNVNSQPQQGDSKFVVDLRDGKGYFFNGNNYEHSDVFAALAVGTDMSFGERPYAEGDAIAGYIDYKRMLVEIYGDDPEVSKETAVETMQQFFDESWAMKWNDELVTEGARSGIIPELEDVRITRFRAINGDRYVVENPFIGQRLDFWDYETALGISQNYAKKYNARIIYSDDRGQTFQVLEGNQKTADRQHTFGVGDVVADTDGDVGEIQGLAQGIDGPLYEVYYPTLGWENTVEEDELRLATDDEEIEHHQIMGDQEDEFNYFGEEEEEEIPSYEYFGSSFVGWNKKFFIKPDGELVSWDVDEIAWPHHGHALAMYHSAGEPVSQWPGFKSMGGLDVLDSYIEVGYGLGSNNGGNVEVFIPENPAMIETVRKMAESDNYDEIFIEIGDGISEHFEYAEDAVAWIDSLQKTAGSFKAPYKSTYGDEEERTFYDELTDPSMIHKILVHNDQIYIWPVDGILQSPHHSPLMNTLSEGSGKYDAQVAGYYWPSVDQSNLDSSLSNLEGSILELSVEDYSWEKVHEIIPADNVVVDFDNVVYQNNQKIAGVNDDFSDDPYASGYDQPVTHENIGVEFVDKIELDKNYRVLGDKNQLYVWEVPDMIVDDSIYHGHVLEPILDTIDEESFFAGYVFKGKMEIYDNDTHMKSIESQSAEERVKSMMVTAGATVREDGTVGFAGDEEFGNNHKFILTPEGEFYAWNKKDHDYGKGMLAIENDGTLYEELDDFVKMEWERDASDTYDFYRHNGYATGTSSSGGFFMINAPSGLNEDQVLAMEDLFREQGYRKIVIQESGNRNYFNNAYDALQYMQGRRAEEPEEDPYFGVGFFEGEPGYVPDRHKIATRLSPGTPDKWLISPEGEVTAWDSFENGIQHGSMWLQLTGQEVPEGFDDNYRPMEMVQAGWIIGDMTDGFTFMGVNQNPAQWEALLGVLGQCMPEQRVDGFFGYPMNDFSGTVEEFMRKIQQVMTKTASLPPMPAWFSAEHLLSQRDQSHPYTKFFVFGDNWYFWNTYNADGSEPEMDGYPWHGQMSNFFRDNGIENESSFRFSGFYGGPGRLEVDEDYRRIDSQDLIILEQNFPTEEGAYFTDGFVTWDGTFVEDEDDEDYVTAALGDIYPRYQEEINNIGLEQPDIQLTEDISVYSYPPNVTTVKLIMGPDRPYYFPGYIVEEEGVEGEFGDFEPHHSEIAVALRQTGIEPIAMGQFMFDSFEVWNDNGTPILDGMTDNPDDFHEMVMELYDDLSWQEE